MPILGIRLGFLSTIILTLAHANRVYTHASMCAHRVFLTVGHPKSHIHFITRLSFQKKLLKDKPRDLLVP